jgi:hypothetical protein
MKRTLTGLSITTLLIGAIGCTPAEPTGTGPSTAPGTNAAANANTGAPSPASYGPGTAQYVLMHQPNYQADITIKTGNLTLTGKVAKVDENWRYESSVPAIGNSVTYVRAGKPIVVLLPDKKQYIEYPATQDGTDFNPIANTIRGLTQQGITFEKSGAEVVDGHPTTKYRGTKAGETGEMTIYSADDLQNLVIRIDGMKENVGFNATWSNISLNPPASVIEPPADYATAFTKIDVAQYQEQFSSGGAESAPPAAANTNAATKKP